MCGSRVWGWTFRWESQKRNHWEGGIRGPAEGSKGVSLKF